MPKDEKTPSADEIIEALALEMGVDEDGEGEEGPKKTDKSTKATPPPLPVADTKEAEQADAAPAAAKEESKPASKETAAAKEKEPKARKEKSTTKKTRRSSKTKAEYVQENIDAIFNVSGEESDRYVEDYYDDDDLDIGPAKTSKAIIGLIVILLITGVGLAATYMVVPDDKRADIPTLAKCYFPLNAIYECVDLQEQRRLRREEEERRRHEAWLDSLPKYGGLTVRTSPSYALFQVDDLTTYVQHPSQENAVVETRSGTTFQNLDVTQHHVVVIGMNNFQERRIEVYPWGEPNTLWQQRQDDGSYFLDLNELLEPIPDGAEELGLRMTPSPMVPELVGSIIVETLPAGATVHYNGRLLVGEDGLPLVTPLTFNAYPPPPQVPDPVTGELPPAPEQVPDPVTGEIPRAPGDPVPVSLSREGVPIRIELEGYVPVVTGVYRHMFICTLDEPQGEVDERPFWERCTYTYNTGVIDLMTPQEFKPEDAEEGTGEGAPTAEEEPPPG